MSKTQIIYALITLLALSLIGGAYAAYTIYTLDKNLATLTETQRQTAGTLSSTTATLAMREAELVALENQLSELTDELDDTEDDLRKEKNRNEDFEDQIEDLTGTVKTLDKLSKTDEELLQKYSKVYFLNENYIPSDIDEIRSKYILAGKDAQFFHGDALPFLEDMLDDADDDDIDLKIISAYRSFDHQQQLKGEFTQVYGSGANAFSADQGYSEHQLGTTLDLTTPAIGGTYESFATTEAYEWLQKNAHKYGFTLSYPENNTFYIFEPWHWRFVGVDLAKDLDRSNAHFYDWDQRKIDEYLISIFD